MLPPEPTAKLVSINMMVGECHSSTGRWAKLQTAVRQIGSPRRTGNTQCSPRLQYPLTVLSSGVGKPVVVQGASGAALVGDRGEVTPSRWSSPIRQRDGGGPPVALPSASSRLSGGTFPFGVDPLVPSAGCGPVADGGRLLWES
jgi:hypothetical protein